MGQLQASMIVAFIDQAGAAEDFAFGAAAEPMTGRHKEALEALDQSLKLNLKDLEQGNESFVVRYDIAAINAIQGRKPQAYEWLQKAIDVGFRNYRFALIDPLLEGLRKDERLQKMMAQVKQ